MQTQHIEEIKEKLRPIFEREPVYRAVLFGSYARGEETEQSDVDLVIDSHGHLVNINFYGLLEDITEALKKEIDLFEIVDIKNNRDFLNSVEREGIVLYEKQGSHRFAETEQLH
ncbi:nucleotidyltransferase family protein [Sporolactobacillus sp. KGMB 08714]|uniref:nucleotidyltransferase family protein n=1 Tax=Sporolactobacillus sp. KGMB 08714 TaxID=3064704 RepID=UPI002FBF0F37